MRTPAESTGTLYSATQYSSVTQPEPPQLVQVMLSPGMIT